MASSLHESSRNRTRTAGPAEAHRAVNGAPRRPSCGTEGTGTRPDPSRGPRTCTDLEEVVEELSLPRSRSDALRVGEPPVSFHREAERVRSHRVPLVERLLRLQAVKRGVHFAGAENPRIVLQEPGLRKIRRDRRGLPLPIRPARRSEVQHQRLNSRRLAWLGAELLDQGPEVLTRALRRPEGTGRPPRRCGRRSSRSSKSEVHLRELVPLERGRDGGSGLRADRVRAGDVRSPPVHVDVEKDLRPRVSSTSHSRVVTSGSTSWTRSRDRADEAPHLIVVMASVERHHDLHAGGAGRLRVCREPELVQHHFDQSGYVSRPRPIRRVPKGSRSKNA